MAVRTSRELYLTEISDALAIVFDHVVDNLEEETIRLADNLYILTRKLRFAEE